MQEKIKGILDKVRQWWKAAAKKTKVLIGAGAVAVLAVILIVVAVYNALYRSHSDRPEFYCVLSVRQWGVQLPY